MLADGGSAEDALQQRIVQEHIIQFVRTMPAGDTTETQVTAIGTAFWRMLDGSRRAHLHPDESSSRETLKTQVNAALVQMNSPWFRFFITPRTGARFGASSLSGAGDEWGAGSAGGCRVESSTYRVSAETGGNSKYRIVKLPGLNHLFQTCKTGHLQSTNRLKKRWLRWPWKRFWRFIRDVTQN